MSARPTFIIAGERRSGTSTLGKWIDAHPEVFLHSRFDRAFFMDDELRGRLEWMDGKIDRAAWDETHDAQKYEQWFSGVETSQLAVGEKSADYFYWDPCMERILRLFPDVKILLTFRDPVERAWSHYWNEVGKGRESLDFEDALAEEPTRIENSDYAKVHLSYFDRGKYIVSLDRWLKHLPASQIQVVILEHLIKDPLQELTRIYEFLGVDPQQGLERAGKQYNHNWTTVPRPFWKKNEGLRVFESGVNWIIRTFGRIVFRDRYVRLRVVPQLERLTRIPQKQIQMPDHVRNTLIDRYAPYTAELQERLQADLSCWTHR